MKNEIIYENKPIGATENSINTPSNAQYFVDMEEIKEDAIRPKKATLENDFWLLDGSFESFPDEPTGLGYVSQLMSNEEGTFENEVSITRVYDNTYTSPGLLIVFDEVTNTYASNVNIKWYRNDELLFSRDYITNSARFFYSQDVVAYNKIKITFANTNIPYRYLRVSFIEDGITRKFNNDELKNLKILEEVSTTTEQLSMNTFDFEIHSKTEVGVLFQKTLPLRLYRDDTLYGAFFIDTASKQKDADYSVSAVDYIGLIENGKHLGGMYTNEPVGNIVADILADIPYTIDETIASRTISGYLEIQTKREALQKVIFASGGIIDCSRSDKLEIRTLNDNVTSNLGENKIISKTENVDSITTMIELNQHKYSVQEEATTLFQETTNTQVLITFDAPYTNLSVRNGTIVSSGANYVVINGTGNLTVTGKGYDELTVVTQKRNPLTVSTDLEKVKTYTTNLICNEIDLLEQLKFISKTLTVKFNMENGEKVGDKVNVLGEDARIISMEYELNSPSIYAIAKMEV